METILIVDDDQVYLDLLKLGLESYGFRVVTAGSAAEGWIKVQEEAVDLVLLDVVMPGEDGYGFAQRLRGDLRLSPIPVLILTGHGGPGERAKAFDCGADEFVVKPCGAGELVSRIRAHLKRRAWQRRIDEGLARIQDLERARDELLALVVHELGGLVAAAEAELHHALEPGRLSGGAVPGVARAEEYVRELAEIVGNVRLRHSWRRLAPLEAESAEAPSRS